MEIISIEIYTSLIELLQFVECRHPGFFLLKRVDFDPVKDGYWHAQESMGKIIAYPFPNFIDRAACLELDK